MSDLKVVEICAGAGGQSLGLHRAGFAHQLAIELDHTAALTLRSNLQRLHGESVDVRVGDVADPGLWTPEKYSGVDLLAGGVPCPPFSVAGKQLGSQDERDLFAWAVELAGRVQPRALLLENVRGLSTPRFAGYRQAVADRLTELGFWSEWRLLNASDFGVAQLRPRFVLVAMRPDDAAHFQWPEPNPAPVTVSDAVSDLMGSGGWRHVEAWRTLAAGIAPTIVGGSKKHGGPDLGPTRARQAWLKLGVDGRGLADDVPDRDAPHPRLRPPRLTNAMVARLQGWNDASQWGFVGRKTSVYRQIGNAFPPPVAEAVGRSIGAALNRSTQQVSASEPAEHDIVYRALRQAPAPLTVSQICELTGLSDGGGGVTRRLAELALDFDVAEVDTDEGLAFELGTFLAFRGQDTHTRYTAFAEPRRLSRIS